MIQLVIQCSRILVARRSGQFENEKEIVTVSRKAGKDVLSLKTMNNILRIQENF